MIASVEDPGLGIAPEDMKGLLTTFHRIRRPETEGIGGTGLGLYIVKGLLDLMGGESRLESAVNRGTTFFVSLPVAPASQALISSVNDGGSS